VASGPFHQHLLDALAPKGATPLLWRSLNQWVDLLRNGELEAVLLASVGPDPKPSEPVEGMAWLPLGCWELLLACRLSGPDSAGAPPPRCFRFLSPPLAAAPALHHALEEQQLAAITQLDAVDPGDWLAALQRGDGLLPVPPSLLQTSPWRQAALTAVWPWEPLMERLWLLVPQELGSHAAVLNVAARLRERIAAAPGPAGAGTGISGPP
jgi:DNA-binding transcriptional LysR family regulator